MIAIQPRKAVFLDLDGVLTTARTRFVEFDPETVSHLNALVRDDVGFVLSSSWRGLLPLADLTDMLRLAGFRGEVSDQTPYIRNVERGVEIAAWLKAHPEVGDFVILDDDADMGELVSHLVQTDSASGLQAADVERAMGILNEEALAHA